MFFVFSVTLPGHQVRKALFSMTVWETVLTLLLFVAGSTTPPATAAPRTAPATPPPSAPTWAGPTGEAAPTDSESAARVRKQTPEDADETWIKINWLCFWISVTIGCGGTLSQVDYNKDPKIKYPQNKIIFCVHFRIAPTLTAAAPLQEDALPPFAPATAISAKWHKQSTNLLS